MKRRLHEFILEAVLIALCILLAWRAPGFLTAVNLLGILRNISMPGVIAFGMTMVIIAGEIDLSVGSAVAFSACLIAWVTEHYASPHGAWAPALAIGVAVVASLIASVITGSVSGALRVRFGVPTFISSLAWFLILRGAAGQLTNGFPITPFPEWYSYFGTGYLWLVPVPAIIFVLVFLLIQFVMTFTTFGRAVYAVGGNAEAARLSGIPVAFIKISVMVIVSALCVLAGLLQSSQMMAGNPTTAQGWELDVIASVIIGGTSLAGGAGRVWGTFIGLIFLGVLLNGMTLLNVPEYWQQIVRGVLILSAVLLNAAFSSRHGRTASP